MPKLYKDTQTVVLPDGADGIAYEVTVSFTVAWGSPEAGRGYMADPYKYDPGSPDVVEDIKVLTVDGKPCDDAALVEALTDKISHDELLAAATEDEIALADAEADCRRRWA